MTGAIKPTTFNIPSFKLDEEASKRGATDEERHLYGLTNQLGWKLVKEFKERVFDEIDDTNRLAISEGKPFDEIGRNTVVINLAKDIVNRIFAKVEDAKEICEAQIDQKE
jgi:hypothetical protein